MAGPALPGVLRSQVSDMVEDRLRGMGEGLIGDVILTVVLADQSPVDVGGAGAEFQR